MQRALPVIDAPIATFFGGCSATYSVVVPFPSTVTLPSLAKIAWGQSNHVELSSDVEEIQERYLRMQAENKLPTTDEMLALIAKNHPPQSWYDEDFSDF
jgi:hypothetical protein